MNGEISGRLADRTGRNDGESGISSVSILVSRGGRGGGGMGILIRRSGVLPAPAASVASTDISPEMSIRTELALPPPIWPSCSVPPSPVLGACFPLPVGLLTEIPSSNPSDSPSVTSFCSKSRNDLLNLGRLLLCSKS